MAAGKKTDKKAGKPGKKGKLPKQVLGVKVPKELRRAGDQLIQTASSPQGREMIAGALTMAAAAATAAVTQGRARAAATRPTQADQDARPLAAGQGAGQTNAPPQGTSTAPDPEAIAKVVG